MYVSIPSMQGEGETSIAEVYQPTYVSLTLEAMNQEVEEVMFIEQAFTDLVIPVAINKAVHGGSRTESGLTAAHKYLARVREFIVLFDDRVVPLKEVKNLRDFVLTLPEPKDIYVKRDLLTPILNRVAEKHRSRITSNIIKAIKIELAIVKDEGNQSLVQNIEDIFILWGIITRDDLREDLNI